MQQFNMEQKEKYKETELGLLPESWKVVKVSSICKTQAGGTPSTFKEEYWNGDIPWINSGALKNVIIKTPSKFITKLGLDNSSTKLWPKNTVVIALTGATTGMVGLLYFNCSANQSVVGILPNEKFDSFYLFYNLVYSRERVLGFCSGAAQPHINKGIVDDFITLLPSITEQKKISYILLTIQEAKEKTENVINSLKELKKSIMKHLFTYGPVSLEKAEKVKLKETEIGMVPEGWNIIPLKEITYFKNGINFEAEQKGDKGILTIDVLNMYGPEISVHLHKLYRVNKEIKKDYLLQDNDILFVRSSLKREGVGWTTLFKKINEPVTYCGFLIRARLNNENFDAEYLTNYLRTNIARSNLVSSSGKVAITNINQGMLGNIEVPKPNKDIQLQISLILSIMDLKIRAEENKKRTLEELFKSMLHNLMTAKIRVNNLEI